MTTPPPLPSSQLGSTGVQISRLALGGVNYHRLPDAEAARVVHRALDLGITYIDTAHGYGESERKIGLVMAERRAEVFLATKSGCRDYDGISAEIEESLRRLQTDRIDCLQLHDLKHDDELRAMAGARGALKAIEQFRAAGTIRFVGITGHRDPALLVRALDVHPFDTILCALGAMHEAVRPFHAAVVPIARARGIGVLGMKVYAYGMLKDCAVDALRFVLGHDGVDAAVVGVDSIEQLEANVRAARAFTPLSSAARGALLDRAAQIYAAKPSDAWFITPPGEAHPDGGAG